MHVTPRGIRNGFWLILVLFLVSGCQDRNEKQQDGTLSRRPSEDQTTVLNGKPGTSNGQSREVANTSNGDNRILELGEIQSEEVLECSGIAVSRSLPGHVWVHNDSGAEPKIYLLKNNGQTRSEVGLNGIKNVDFEDIATFTIDSQNYVAIGDIGNNSRKQRDVLQIHLIKDPASDNISTNLSVDPLATIHFRFPDGKRRDLESLAYHSTSKRLFVCSKPRPRQLLTGEMAELFSIDFDCHTPVQKREAEFVGKVEGGLITGMDLSPDGKQLVVCNYLYANLWSISSEKIVAPLKLQTGRKITLPPQRQREAICFADDSKSLLTTSEGKNPMLYQIELN